MGLADFTDKGRRVGSHFFRAVCALLVISVCMALSSASQAADAPLKATGYKMAGDATKMRIVMNLDRDPDLKWFLLRGPNRLVIDLKNTKFALDAKDLKARGLVKGVRLGDLGEGVSRLILTGKCPFAVDKLDVLKN
jgi:N-acetylmuramoyl-L-alanine amidase